MYKKEFLNSLWYLYIKLSLCRVCLAWLGSSGIELYIEMVLRKVIFMNLWKNGNLYKLLFYSTIVCHLTLFTLLIYP
jgi:hypothetical protein